jgi:hypothetical protein
MTRMSTRWVAIAVAMLPFAACDESGPAAVPSEEELQAAVMAPEDLGGEWAPWAFDKPAPPNGIPMCPEADPDDLETLAGVEWQASTLLVWPVGETPRAGEGPDWSALLFQWVAAGDPDDLDAVFSALDDAMAVCTRTGDEPLPVTRLSLSDVGDRQLGWQIAGAEGQIDDWSAFVRVGPVLMWIDVRAFDPVITEDRFDAIVAAAADRAR